MNNLNDILEICLQELENGADLETVLARYPKMAAELRPMLQAALTAKLVTIPRPAENILARNQAKFLQQYDRILDPKPVARNWFLSSRRMVAAFVLLVLFFFSGTNMVRASFKSLPGDSLYPVKRSWEKITLFFTADERSREKLEIKYEGERLKELDQLFGSGRTARVDFVGIVNFRKGEEWRVANISVIVSAQTDLPSETILNGNLVRVIGTTSGSSVVVAERIELLDSGTPDGAMIETDQPNATPQPENESTGSGSGTETPDPLEIQTASPTPDPKIESFEGILISIDQGIWKINAVLVEANNAEIEGVPVIGATIKAEGYFGTDDIFIATKLEVINNDLNDNNTNNGDGNVNINGNTNTDDNGGGGNSGSGKNGNGGNDNGGNGNDDG